MPQTKSSGRVPMLVSRWRKRTTGASPSSRTQRSIRAGAMTVVRVRWTAPASGPADSTVQLQGRDQSSPRYGIRLPLVRAHVAGGKHLVPAAGPPVVEVLPEDRPPRLEPRVVPEHVPIEALVHERVHLGAELRQDHHAQARVLEDQRLEIVIAPVGVDADGGQLRSSCRPGPPAVRPSGGDGASTVTET